MPAHRSLDWICSALEDCASHHLLRTLKVRSGPQGREIVLQGKRLINFGSNDYLGLAADERLTKAARDCLEQSGWGAGASPLVAGRTALHAELERRLAAFEQTENALCFPSGYAANLGTVAALASKSDAIFSDALNHASLIDGCRLAGAEVHVYQHADIDHLTQLLKQTTTSRRRLIVSDSLFSMDGDFAPVPQLVEVAHQFDAMLLLDEAHATGVWGAQGRGVAEHLACVDDVPIRVGTLSKALGSQGGFVVGSYPLIQWCANRARPYVFSTAAPAATCAAAIAALGLVRDYQHRRVDLQTKAERLRTEFQSLGLDTAQSTSQIIPIVLGDPQRTMQVAEELQRRGLFVPGIRPPSVPPHAARLRISLTSLHRDEDLTQLVDAVREAI